MRVCANRRTRNTHFVRVPHCIKETDQEMNIADDDREREKLFDIARGDAREGSRQSGVFTQSGAEISVTKGIIIEGKRDNKNVLSPKRR